MRKRSSRFQVFSSQGDSLHETLCLKPETGSNAPSHGKSDRTRLRAFMDSETLMGA